jgi:hypothetical protein
VSLEAVLKHDTNMSVLLCSIIYIIYISLKTKMHNEMKSRYKLEFYFFGNDFI